MKRLFGILMAASVVIFSSCDDGNEPIQESVVFEEDINSAATIDALFEDVDDVADFGAESVPGARLRFGDTERFANCATVTYDETTGTVTVDFGEEGCLGRDGRTRIGKIHFTHTGEHGQPGETKVLTFEDFSVDSIGIEGVRTLENKSIAGAEEKVLSITLEGGKVTFPDGTFVTREADKVRAISFNTEEEKFQAAVYGGATGLNKDGLTYTHSINESTPLLFTRACRESASLAAVSGVLLIQVQGESDKTIDFGDGSCDNLVTVTQDGVSTEIEINPREKRRRHFRK